MKPLSHQPKEDVFHVDASTNLEEVLDILSEKDEVYVKSNGEIIGKLDRQMIVHYFATSFKEGGEAHV